MSPSPLHLELERILAHNRLSTLLQPVLDLDERRIMGYEALTRGPARSPLHRPDALFSTAAQQGSLAELDLACLRVAFRTFASLKLSGRLFVNLSPGSLLHPALAPAAIVALVEASGLSCNQIVIEMTEAEATLDYDAQRDTVTSLRAWGIDTAIDDLGEGFSSLRLWSELKPAFVKIDKHFIRGVDEEAHKTQFVRSIQQLAEGSNSRMIAEGVERLSELTALKDIGVRFVQGFLVGRPSPVPIRVPPRQVEAWLNNGRISVFPNPAARVSTSVTATRLVTSAPAVEPGTPCQTVLDLMMKHRELHAVAVVDEGVPVGILHRPALLDSFIGLYGRELHGRKPCSEFMDDDPLIVDKGTQIAELSDLVVKKGKAAFTQGFIVTADGRYLGVGSGFDLMREVTEMQIVAARYANPLTDLPGNVPIQEHMERLLKNGKTFVTAYFDLDQFKPYNDVYGFRRGDEIIQLLANILRESCPLDQDFVGHIGGDDFVVLFQSLDWEVRCHGMLARFDRECRGLFHPEHLLEGGYRSADRRGIMTFHGLVTLSIGAVLVDPEHFHECREIARAAAEAKHMAKRMDGSRLFVDRRRLPFARTLAPDEKQRAAS